MQQDSIPWSEADIEQLKWLLTCGVSMAEIGRRLGRTRAAVGALCHRHGLKAISSERTKRKVKPKPKPTAPAPGEGKARPKRLKLRRVDTALAVMEARDRAAGGVLVPLLELTERHCRWPVGDPKQPDFGFCGRPREPASSYCSAHRARAQGRDAWEGWPEAKRHAA